MAADKQPNLFARLRSAIFPTAPSKLETFIDNQPNAYREYNGNYTHMVALSFDGEKNLGDMGPAKDYYMQHDVLRVRAWQSYAESEVTASVIDKMVRWIISSGLKLQCNPDEVVLRGYGININKEFFNEIVERRFAVWAASNYSSYNGNEPLYKLAQRAYKNGKVGGDVLTVLRYNGRHVTVEIIDGAHVCNPPTASPNGNIRHGVERNEMGQHVAYWVRKKPYDTSPTFEWVRVPAYSASTGLRMAYLTYGNEFRLNNTRGLPIISVVLETLKKLEDYKEATLGSAQEVAKIALQIVHQAYSTGESPFLDQLAKISQADNGTIPVDDALAKLVKTVASTTKKQAFNMPLGAELKPVEFKGTIAFKEFYETNADKICAAIGIPPNVAFSMYNDSFSASRAATKDWEHTIDTERHDFMHQWYMPIYTLWLYTEALNNRVAAPGFVDAVKNKDLYIVGAYTAARFTGPKFPHIDPVKEVEAERRKLGPAGAHLPLTTLEAATEHLYGGDSDSNMQQFAEEVDFAKSLGIEPIDKSPAPPSEKSKRQ